MSTDSRAVSVDDVIRATAEHFQVPPGALTGSSRSRELVRARHIAMLVARDGLGSSLSEVAAAFGRAHHSAVAHAVNRCRPLVSSQPVYTRAVSTIADALGLSGSYVIPDAESDAGFAPRHDLPVGLITVHTDRRTERPLLDRLGAASSIDLSFNSGTNFFTFFDSQLVQALSHGCHVRVVITEPTSPVVADSRLSEVLCPGGDVRSALTFSLKRLRRIATAVKSDANSTGRLVLRRSLMHTCNMILVDDTYARVTPLLPHMHSNEVPSFDFVRQPDGAFSVYRNAFSRQWHDAVSEVILVGV